MISIEYFLWLQFTADKKNFTLSDWGTYSYIAALSLVQNTQRIRLTAAMIATALQASERTVLRSLKKLADNGLIRWTGNGYITVLAPAPSWLDKYFPNRGIVGKVGSQKNGSSITRASNDKGAVDTTPKGVSTVAPSLQATLDELDKKALSSDYLGLSLHEILAKRGIKLAQ